MSKLIRRTVGRKKGGTALIVALQLTALTFLSLVSFVGKPQQQSRAGGTSAGSQPSAAVAGGADAGTPFAQAQTQSDQTQTQTAQAPTAADKSALRASAHFAKKLQEPLATQVFDLATSRAESTQHSAQQSSQEGEEPTEGPTLTTDREDYPPFSYVYFHGSGFQPGETVDMLVVETDPIQQSFDPWQVVADENGEFDTSWYIFSSDFQGATFLATATGETSQLTASVTFTDAFGDGTMDVSPGSALTSSTGNSFTFSFRNVAQTFGANSYATVVVPAGWTAPQTSSSGSPGYVNATPFGAGSTVTSTAVTGTGPWTITVTFQTTTINGKGFDLSYGGGGTQVTAPSTGVYTFTTSNHNGSGGTPTAIFSSPSIVVSPTILQRGTATTASVSTGTSLTINKPSGVVAGDLMISKFAIQNTTSGAPTSSGWTSITTANPAGQGSGTGVRAALLYKVAGASEPANYTFTWTTSNAAQGAIVAFSGVDTVSGPFDVAPGTYTTGDGGGGQKDPAGVTAITTVTANAAIVMFASSPANYATGMFTTATSPGVLSELYGDVVDSNANGGAAWGIKTSAGSTGAGSATRNPSGGNNAWAAILLALKPITCTSPSVTTNPSNVTKTYGDASATFTAAASGTPAPTVQWQVSTNGGGSFSNLNNGGNISGATTGTLTISNPTVAMSGNQYQAVFTNTCNGTQTATSSAATLTVNKANATVVVTPYSCPSTTYTGLPHTATVTSITGVNGETGATVGTVDLSNTTHTNAGTYSSDYWTFAGTANYNDIAVHQTITDCIAKANATVVVTPYTCPSTTYDGSSHTATYTITGVNGETGATVGTVDVSNTTHTNAGTYNTDSWSFTGTVNYNNIAATTITDCIAKANATVVVTPYTCPATTYDGNPHTAAITSITGVNGETGVTVGTVDVSNTTHTNAGTYASDYWTFTGTGNYNDISAHQTITDCIAKANATVVVTPYTCPAMTYDGNPHTAAITSITGVNGETGATVGTVDVSNTTHTNAGTYASDYWTFTGTGNYNDISAHQTIADCIAKANATVVVTPYTCPATTYDGNPHTAAIASITGVNGETGATVGTVDVSNTTHTNAGTYASDYWTFTGTGNYNDISAHQTITDCIVKANATVVVTPYTCPTTTYTGLPHTATYTITGVNGETGATVGTVNVTDTMHTHAGIYSGDPWNFTGSGNYNDQNGTVDDCITKADATVVVTPYICPATTYTGLPHTATYTITGVNGETGGAVGTLNVSGTSHIPAGTYNNDPWSFTGGADYKDQNGTVNDCIAKADATVVVTPYTCPSTTYTGLPHTATYTLNGVNGETGTTVGTVDVSNTTHTNAGTYASDYWSFAGGANYNNIGNTTISDCIAKADATVVVTPYTCPSTTYTGLPHTATYTLTGVNGESGGTVGMVDVSGTSHIPAGTYNNDPWSFTGTANYNNTSGTVDDCIAKANATVVVTPYTCPSTTYTGLPHTATYTITGVNGESGGTVGTVDVSGTSHIPAGEYNNDPWSFTGSANYTDQNGTVNDCIAKADATVVVTPYTCPSTTYTGLAYTATYTITGVNGESGGTVGTVDVTGTSHIPVGTYNNDPWSFTGTANYNNTSGTVDDCIAKANATVVVTPYTCPSTTYTGIVHTASYTITGVNGESGGTVGTVDVSGTSHIPAGTYNNDPWSFTGGANYNDQNGTVNDCIAKADATVIVTPYICPSTTYTGLPHTATYTITGVNGETGNTVGTVNVSGTTHTPAGTYNNDPWSFTGANYNDQNGTVNDCIAKADATVVLTPYICPGTTYTGLPHTATYMITGVNGESGNTVGTINVSGTTHTPAGTYNNDPWSFTGGANYNNQNGTVNDCIAKANAVVVVTPYTCPTTTYTGLLHTATVTSITGVNGEMGATVGTVDVSNTTHTSAATYASDYWFFTGTANYNNIGNTTITDCVAKANATVVVTAYHVAYDTNPHTATYTLNGVNGETGATVGTVDVSQTTHTLPGNYNTDYWFFTGAANYNNIGNTTITDTIGYGTCTGPNGPGGVILQPINADGTSVVKQGSTVPVKFTICDANGNPISDPMAVFGTSNGSITLISAVRGTVDNVNETADNDIPDVAFRYSSGIWIFNMATNNLTKNTTYTYHINLKVGTINFTFGTK